MIASAARLRLFSAIALCVFLTPQAALADPVDAPPRSASSEDGTLLNQARVLVDAGQSESAREILRTYLAGAGRQKDYAEFLLALTYFHETDPTAPMRAVDDFQKRFPKSKYAPMALFRLGQYYRTSLRDPARAILVYSKFLRDYPSDDLSREVHLRLASALIDDGQYDRAIATVHQALGIYAYEDRDKKILEGLLDFARQSTGRVPSGGVTIDVRPPVSARRTDGRSESADRAARPAPEPPSISPPARAPAEGPPPALPPLSEIMAPSAPVSPFDTLAASSARGKTVLMNFRDAEIDDVLNSLAEEMGLTFIKDEEVQGKVTIINPRELPAAEAVYLLESVLELKGFAMVRSGNVYKILPAQKSYTKGLDVYPPDQPVFKEDRPITKIVRLNHALAQDVVQALQPMVGDAGTISADVSKNSIVLTGMASNLSRLEIIAKAIDNSGESDFKELFQLKFLSAGEALPLVQKLLATTQPENLGALKLVAGPTPSYLFGVGPLEMIFKVRDILKLVDIPGFKEESLKVYSLKFANAEKLAAFLETLLAKGLPGASDPGAAPSRPGIVSADRITNSIVVLGSRAFHDVIAPLIERLDYEGFAAFRVQVIPLRYAYATDLANKFENIVARGFGPQGSAFSNQILIQADARLNALLIASASQSLLKTLASLAAALDRPAEDAGPKTVVYYLENADASKLVTVLADIYSKSDAASSDATKVVADKGTNSLVIVAARENYDAVVETVMKLDIPPYQVLVEAVILEVTLDEATDLGVDWTLKNSNIDFDLRTSGTTFENLALTGIKQAVVKNNNELNGLIHALLAKTNTKVLATPRIFAANNQEASILIGDQVPVKTGSSTTTGGVTQNTFEYKDVGIKLKVTPHINRKRQTALDITQEIKTIRSSSTTSENPTFQTREAKTNAVLGDGQTVIIAGLIRTDRTQVVSKVPVLGDLPILGAAFRKKRDADQRTELMIFITPTVVETEAEMAAAVDAQKRAAEKAGLGRTDVEFDSPVRPGFIRDFILK